MLKTVPDKATEFADKHTDQMQRMWKGGMGNTRAAWKSHVDMLKRMPQEKSYQNTQDLQAEEKGRSRQIDGLTSGPSIAQGGTNEQSANRLHAGDERLLPA